MSGLLNWMDLWERMGGCTDQSLASVLSDHFLVPHLHSSVLMGFTPAGYIFQVPLLAGFQLGSVTESNAGD